MVLSPSSVRSLVPRLVSKTASSGPMTASSSQFQFQQPGLQGLAELGYPDHWNLLMTALESRQCPEMSLRQGGQGVRGTGKMKMDQPLPCFV